METATPLDFQTFVTNPKEQWLILLSPHNSSLYQVLHSKDLENFRVQYHFKDHLFLNPPNIQSAYKLNPDGVLEVTQVSRPCLTS